MESRQLLAQMPLITEFMASNDTTILDGDGRSSDWIEIHNASDAPVDLSGWHLTDDSAQLGKWEFPATAQSVLDPGEYLLVFASGKATASYVDPLGFLHTTFKIGASGEYLALTDASQQIVHAYAPEFPEQQTDVSYGVQPDCLPAGPVFFAQPTPGAPNSIPAVAESIGFSRESGTFTGSFQLRLAGAVNANQSIVYTLDGSTPDSGSTVYVQPLIVDRTIQVRARIVEGGKSDGPVSSANYSRLGTDVRDFESQLPVVLIENFGGGRIPSKDWNQTGAGIHQVARQPSAVTVFGNSTGASSLDGTVELHSRSGIRTRGAFSTTFPEPQYSLETWNEFDDDKPVGLFGMAEESDWILYSPNPQYDQTLMNNQFMFGLANETSLWAPKVQFVEAFVNTDGGDVTMDDYVGLYVWQEKVKRDPGRLDFEKFADDGSSGGWLLSINRIDPIPFDDPTATPQFFHTPGPNDVLQTGANQPGVGDDIPRQYNAHLNFEHPNGYDVNAVQRQAIEDWFANMEDVLYGRTDVRWNDPVHGYAKYIDVDNFIDYYILHNLSRNGDGLLLSMWIYNPDPNNGGKLKFGPPWDHDLGAFEGSATSSTKYRADRLWYDRLFDDPAFERQYQNRWHNLRQGILSDDGVSQVFDDFVEEIGAEAIARDGVTNLTSRITTVKNWLTRRAGAIDNATGGAVSVAFSTSQTSGAPPLTVQFTNQSNVPGATSWVWDFGDGNSSTLQNPLHTYTTSGFYDVTLTVTGDLGPISTIIPSLISAVTPGDINSDGVLDQLDVDQFIAGWRSDTEGLSDLEKVAKGDLNRDGTTNFSDWHLLRMAWQAAGNSTMATINFATPLGEATEEAAGDDESVEESISPVKDLADGTSANSGLKRKLRLRRVRRVRR